MYHLNNKGGGGCAGGFAARTPPIFPQVIEKTPYFVLSQGVIIPYEGAMVKHKMPGRRRNSQG